MEAEGVNIVVSDLAARFRRPARYGEVVRVATRLSGLRSRGCSFAYRVTLPDGSAAVEGETVHLFVDRASGHPTGVPGPVRAALSGFAGL
jgi:acyl-CoA thioester hydrolase